MAETVPVIRRQNLFFGGGVRESLNESALDTFRLKVPASLATTDKMVFDFRSPASGLLCHPLAWLEAKFTIKVPGGVSQATQYSAGICTDNLGADAGLGPAEAAAASIRTVRKVPLISFADGDGGFGGSISHVSCVLNGSSFTMNNLSEYGTRLSTSADAARRFAKCGGPYDASDSQGTKVFTRNRQAAAECNQFRGIGYGQTADSGVAARCRAFYSCIEAWAAGTAGQGATEAGRSTLTVKVRWPVCVPPFNPFYGIQDMHVLSPWAQQPLGLANINQCQISILFQNLTATLFRDLTDRVGALDNCGQGIQESPIEVALVPNTTNMFVKYYRLQSFRNVPSIQSISTMKMMVSSSANFPSVAAPGQGIAVAHGTLFSGSNDAYLVASGRDITTLAINGAVASQNRTVAAHANFYTASISNISYPQLPQYLMFVFQKSVDCYSHSVIGVDPTTGVLAPNAEARGLRPIINRSSNASIRKLYLQLQTSEHVYSYSTDATAELDQQILYEDTVRNCCRDYFGYEAWQRSECCLLLSSDTYCPLGLSPGTVMPVQISAQVELQNRNVSISGTNPIAGTAAAADGAHVATPQELAVGADRIQGRLLMIGIFTRGVATISPSSCVLSTMAISQAQASEILSRNP